MEVFIPSWSRMTNEYRSHLPLLPTNRSVLEVALSRLSSHRLFSFRQQFHNAWRMENYFELQNFINQTTAYLIQHENTNVTDSSVPLVFPIKSISITRTNMIPTMPVLQIDHYPAILPFIGILPYSGCRNIRNRMNSEVNKALTAIFFFFLFVSFPCIFIGWPKFGSKS